MRELDVDIVTFSTNDLSIANHTVIYIGCNLFANFMFKLHYC